LLPSELVQANPSTRGAKYFTLARLLTLMHKIVLIWILLFAGISPAMALFSGSPRYAPPRIWLSAPLCQSLGGR